MSAVTDLPGAAIRHGHRELLATLGDFLRELEEVDGAGGGEALDTARGAVAFLRQGLLPFARREEAWLREGGRSAEGAAWEHAFLAAEVAALASEAADLAPAGGDGAALARVRRRAHRIEAVLELHALRGEDEGEDGAAPSLPAAEPVAREPSARSRPSGAGEMGEDEVRRFLAGHWWGVLATIGERAPYAVPAAYAWDGRAFYLATRGGRKAENLDARPAASLTVLEVDDGERWRSVVAAGPARWVGSLPEKLRAFELLRRQRGTRGRISAADAARIAGARVLRLEPEELSGRARGC